MDKKKIIIYSCIAVVVIAIIITLLLITKKQKVKIEVYSFNLDLENTIEIKDSKDIKKLNKMFKEAYGEDNSQNLGIKPEIKVVFSDGRSFILQRNNEEYCLKENTKNNTKRIVNIPEGLLDIVNNYIQ